MRRLVGVAVAAAFAGTFAPLAAQDFEGVIVYEMAAAGQSMSITQSMKGGRMHSRMQSPMGVGEMISIMDARTTDVITLLPAQQMYVKMNLNDMMAALPDTGPAPEPEDFRATGRTETIAGHTCEHFEYAKDSMQMDVCAAKGLGFMPFSALTTRPGAAPMADAAAFKKHFADGFLPLAMDMKKDGMAVTMRATRVEQTSIDDAIFRIPEGYTEMKMPGGG